MATALVKEPLLQIEPSSELKFTGPFTDVVTAYIELTNHGNKTVCFKVKTTAPRKYCVRPNCGYVEPRSTAQVMVMLQPFEFCPNEKNKHKFMVQAVVDAEERIPLEQLWKEVKPEDISETKLKCVFELPDKGIEAVTENASPKAVKSLTAEPPETAAPRANNDELIILKEKLSQVTKENFALKDEVAKLNKSVNKLPVGVMPHPVMNKPHNIDAGTWNLYLICAIIAAIVGLIVGKLFL